MASRCSACCAVAAIGFVLNAIGGFARWTSWRPVLLPVSGLSLVLMALDFNMAFAAIAVDAVIPALLLFVRQ